MNVEEITARLDSFDLLHSKWKPIGPLISESVGSHCPLQYFLEGYPTCRRTPLASRDLAHFNFNRYDFQNLMEDPL